QHGLHERSMAHRRQNQNEDGCDLEKQCAHEDQLVARCAEGIHCGGEKSDVAEYRNEACNEHDQLVAGPASRRLFHRLSVSWGYPLNWRSDLSFHWAEICHCRLQI